MNQNRIFENFSNGQMRLPDKEKSFKEIIWSKHPTFEGVELKHILTSKDTEGLFSYHLVRIAPGRSISRHIHGTQLETHEVISGSGICINDGKKLVYESGTISIFPAGVPHEVNAGEEGLFIFAKFFPPLC
ncbi:cupin domain-containing protein [Lachnospiraceae bacterium MD1]|uniref:Cupin domain-containing protein n=1 Tax=Variimorphobacter saccharofermentans TaxID=2755051 RepID=A0A839JZT6_9FIRM|nr:cupin domain-containing protein [Variimorphobacter saccharofermentans]MBB2182179.1 cupin domain-containing protein [Variimorphobacter saccharofermentans]